MRILIFWALVLGAATAPAQHSLSSGIEYAAHQLREQLNEKKLPDGARVAVLDFRDTDGNQSLVGRYLAEELATTLIKDGKFRVVERTRIDSILEELGRSDVERQLVNPEFAEKFRGLSGADYVVLGSLFRASDHVALNARWIETLKGDAHAAASVRFRLGPNGNIDTGLGTGPSAGRRTQSVGKTAMTLLGCQRIAQEISCRLNITWNGGRGRMAVLPSSTAVQGNRTLTLRSLSIRDVTAPAGVNATSAVNQGDTVPATVHFATAGNDNVITRLTVDLNAPDGQGSAFAFADVPLAQ